MNSEKTMDHASRLGSRGFTLIEIIVILAVISILVAFLTPSVLKYVADAQVARAQGDVNTLQAVVNDLIKDTGKYPGATADKQFLCGPGNVPTGTGWATAASGAAATTCSSGSGTMAAPNSLANHLVVNDPNEDGATNASDYPGSGNFRWKGPYGQSINTDPWGNAYEINVSTLVGGNTSPTWIISAGPNGVIDTAPTATTLASDDIGVRIK